MKYPGLSHNWSPPFGSWNWNFEHKKLLLAQLHGSNQPKALILGSLIHLTDRPQPVELVCKSEDGSCNAHISPYGWGECEKNLQSQLLLEWQAVESVANLHARAWYEKDSSEEELGRKVGGKRKRLEGELRILLLLFCYGKVGQDATWRSWDLFRLGVSGHNVEKARWQEC